MSDIEKIEPDDAFGRIPLFADDGMPKLELIVGGNVVSLASVAAMKRSARPLLYDAVFPPGFRAVIHRRFDDAEVELQDGDYVSFVGELMWAKDAHDRDRVLGTHFVMHFKGTNADA